MKCVILPRAQHATKRSFFTFRQTDNVYSLVQIIQGKKKHDSPFLLESRKLCPIDILRMLLHCLWTFSFANNHSVARAIAIVYHLTRNGPSILACYSIQ